MSVHGLSLAFSEPAVLCERPSLRRNPAEADQTVDSDALLKGRREILIRHGDRVYRLRHTSNDKLILTK
jgi:hemin uptake protein HemP